MEILIAILASVGAIKLAVEGVESVAKKFVLSTPTKKDDELLSRFTNNKIYIGVRYVLSLLTSIKLKK